MAKVLDYINVPYMNNVKVLKEPGQGAYQQFKMTI
ncbi:hypothetical protein DFR98_003141 [Clostridium saccharobutylicum]|nr:hypothetical protein [Clostridium saccharobutylicum]